VLDIVCVNADTRDANTPFLAGKGRDVLQMRSAQTCTNTHEIFTQIQACGHAKPYVLLVLIARDEKVLQRGFISFSLMVIGSLSEFDHVLPGLLSLYVLGFFRV
jgi:hypothetical protein